MKIEGMEEVKSVIGEWFPSDLAFVTRIMYDSERAELALYADCQKRSKSWPDFDEKFDKILLNFKGVSNLHLRGFGQSGSQIVGFDIIAPTVKGGYYEIEDYEDDKIKFICDSISIRLISKGCRLE